MRPVSHSDQAGGLREATHNVEALHRLAAGAFDDVVLGTQDQEAPGARIESPGEFQGVGADDVLGVGKRFAFENPDERFVGIGGPITGTDLLVES